MKNTVFIMLFVITLRGIAQTDSIKVVYTQEATTIENNRFDMAICELLTKREQEEKDLWKLNLISVFIAGLDLSYERKIAAKWSCNVNSKSVVLGIPNPGFHSNISSTGINNGFRQDLSVSLRYYYGLERRKRLGKKFEFRGGYFFLEQNNIYITQKRGGYKLVSTVSGNQYEWISSSSETLSHSLNIGYGLQLKMGKVFYFDSRIGVGKGFFYGHENNYNRNYNSGSLLNLTENSLVSHHYFSTSFVGHFGLGMSF